MVVILPSFLSSIFHLCCILCGYQSHHCQWNVIYGNQKPPHKYHSTNQTTHNKVESPYSNRSTQTVIARYQSKEHSTDTKGNATKYPHQKIVCFPIFDKHRFEYPIEQQCCHNRPYCSFQKVFENFTCCHNTPSF